MQGCPGMEHSTACMLQPMLCSANPERSGGGISCRHLGDCLCKWRRSDVQGVQQQLNYLKRQLDPAEGGLRLQSWASPEVLQYRLLDAEMLLTETRGDLRSLAGGIALDTHGRDAADAVLRVSLPPLTIPCLRKMPAACNDRL